MVFEKLKKLIANQFTIEEEQVSMQTSFVDDLGADSLDIVEFSMALEEEFDLPELEEMEMGNLKTVGDVVRYINNIIGD